MNFFKKTLLIVSLFAIGSMNARAVSKRTTEPVAQTKPYFAEAPKGRPTPTKTTTTPTVAPQQPVVQPRSYAQALATIKKWPSDKVLRNNSFTQEFIDFITSLDLFPIETRALLEAGVNIHATWTDNDETNARILLSLKNDIESITQPKPITSAQPTIQPKPTEQILPRPIVEHPKPIPPVQPTREIRPVTTPKPFTQTEQLKPTAKPIIPTTDIKPTEQPQPILPITPIEPIKPVEQPQPTLPSKLIPQPNDLLGKVKKLENNIEIYVGAGTSATGEPIFFAMEKLDDERTQVWQKYTSALLNYYPTQVIKRLRTLNNKCNDEAFLKTLQNDPYTEKLTAQMCQNKKKFSILFDSDDGIGGGIVGLDQMIHRYSDDGDVIYIAYASNEPITGPFKPKKEIDLQSFTLEDFEKAYSNIVMCVGVDMMQKLQLPVSTEHRGIFKNPFNEIRGTYKNIALKLHGWAGTVEEQFFNKKYMTVFPTEHAAKLLHSSIEKGDLYLGTDKKPFPYSTYYTNDAELKLIKEKFPPIKQELIGDAPTTTSGGTFEHLHVFALSTLSTYYTNK